jgi:hypothetical protein
MDNDNLYNNAAPVPKVIPVAIRYGLITGLALIIFNLILFFTNNYGNMFLSLLGLLITIVGIVMAHNHFKKLNAGYMTYGQGLGLGVLLAGVSGVLTGLFLFIYMQYIDPSVLDQLRETQMGMMSNFNIPEDQMDKIMEDVEKKNTPGRHFINQILGSLVLGLILSLIIAAITKRNRPEFE